ncbi:hypothetical protein BJV78DRAFT_1157138 [Lactifluus subvellereus]|nr:hypothetical protein BJV78DRAFT_1157138 [Lactifluus subvellereus]
MDGLIHPTDLPYVLLNPPAVLGFLILPPVQPGDKDDTGTNEKRGKYGKQLPAKYKRMFANKQIVCIEYLGTSEDDEREIFRYSYPIFLSLPTILDPRPIIKSTTTTTSQQTTWLKNTAPLDPAWKKRVRHTYKLLIDTLKAYPVPRSCNHSADRPRDDGFARVRIPGQAVGVTVCGCVARATHVGTQGDKRFDVEVRNTWAITSFFWIIWRSWVRQFWD